MYFNKTIVSVDVYPGQGWAVSKEGRAGVGAANEGCVEHGRQ